MKINNSHGLSVNILQNGSIQRIDAESVMISLRSVSPYSKPGASIYLRKRGQPFQFTPLFGPESNSLFQLGEDAFLAKGSWEDIDYTCLLQLSKNNLSWMWQIEMVNNSTDAVELDLIYVQDAGLKPTSNGPVNEYYLSQYLERLILEDPVFGSVICCRQNMHEAGKNPWLMMACKNGALAASTDGMQFYGKSFRETGIPEGLLSDKPGGEYAGESSILALQQRPFRINAGETQTSIFVAVYLPDHPGATSNSDLELLPDICSGFEAEKLLPFNQNWNIPVKNLFNTSPFLPVDDLSHEEINLFFGSEKRFCETENDRLLSFFCNQHDHVMLRAKETMADRPHGHIMQANTGLVPHENIVSTNAFAYGVFNSHLTQGNTNFNTLLSVCSSQFNLTSETGQRMMIKLDGRYYLLGVPSAFEIGLNHCRWIYRYHDHCFQIRTWTSTSHPQVNFDFKVISGRPVDLLIINHFDESNGWSISPGTASHEFVAKPRSGSLIASHFLDAQFRIIVQGVHTSYKVWGDEVLYPGIRTTKGHLFVLDVRETADFCMSYIGEVSTAATVVHIQNSDNQWSLDKQDALLHWKNLSLNLSLQGKQEDIRAICEILPWYGMNALTHFLTPYGLEQFGGAAWGTRDVSQGPIELLLCMEKYVEARQVLRIIFSNQHSDGGWPQWWMFDSYSHIRAHDAHGDVVYWCLIALSNYIKVTGDLSILDEKLPYFNEKNINNIDKTPLSEHVDRLIKMIVDSFIPGTALVPFGGGDWNDSLQPVSKELAQRMISSWTVEMNYQAFMQYQPVFELTNQKEKADHLKNICKRIKTDFNKYLVKDGTVAGYGLTEKDGSISVLLHPGDHLTGIHYSILPMNRGIISGMFSYEQAMFHQDLVEKHLKGPDGARLMDRPLKYRGGKQTIFQRAESSTFFGREIGLMYIHEHIRYAESLAIMGKAEAFIKALRQANPVAYREIVNCGDIRQSNCYYSSSDVAFKSRYEADQRYDEIKSGNITLRGGWRVYSSGPGIYINLVVSRLLGLRIEYGNFIIDPVMPQSFDGLSVRKDFMGYPVIFSYKIIYGNFSPDAVFINGKAISFQCEQNIYRKGGAVITLQQFLSLLNMNENIVEILV